MRTIFVTPEFPLNRRMRRAVQRGKLEVVRVPGERLSLGGGMALDMARTIRTFSSPLVCMADGGMGSVGGAGETNDSYPEEIYMYCPFEKAEGILQNSGLRLKSNKDFNDPFDGKFIRKWPPDDKALFRLVEKNVGKGASKTLLNDKYQEARCRKKKWPDGDTPELREHVEKTGNACFSEIRDSILMWGHYADKHKGVCLGFHAAPLGNYTLDFSPGCVLGKVQYSSKFPVVTEKTKSIPLFRKARDWGYEKEWRIVATDLAGEFLPLPQRVFSSVIFGAKITEEEENRIIGIVRAGGYDVEWLKAQILPRKYGLEISRHERAYP